MSNLPESLPNDQPYPEAELVAEGNQQGRAPNPFSSLHSGYGHIVDGVLTSPYPEGSDMREFHLSAHQYVKDYVLDKDVDIARGDRRFPCIFGQAAFRTNQYAFSAYDDLEDPDNIEGILHDIIQSQHEFDIPASPPRTKRIFRSTLVAFRQPEIRDEMHGAEVLYQLLGKMHERNAQHYGWPESYSKDTDSPDFGFGIGETAHFIAYFHPHAAVPARRSDVQFMVFNSHDMVYEYKAAKGMLDHAKKKAEIRRRQEQPVHPYLGDHGVVSDWLQYALLTPDTVTAHKERVLRRAILGECPFQPPEQEPETVATVEENNEA